MLLKLISVLFISISVSLISVESQSCSKGCDLALASYYVWPDVNLTFISEVLNSNLSPYATTNFDAILRYNNLSSKDSILSGTRINIPFPCDCINGEFLGHVFQFKVRSRDTYDKIASEYYANLTTVEWLQRFNAYTATNIPDTGTVNVTVNCSCVDASISKDFGLFITYPLRPGETLASVLNRTNLSPDLSGLVRGYNPGVNFGTGTGLVYIPGRGSDVLGYNAIIGLAVAASTIMLLTCFSIRYLWERRSLSNRNKVHLRQWKINNRASTGTFFKEYGSLAPEQYSYSDIKKITNKFKEKLGQGGYGSVFKGKLPDGRLVAVKVLSEFKGNGEEFMNELASIGTTSHVNIVTLMGFCYERSKRALVYEFMANGSLDKFIYNHQGRQLGWETLYDIALGIARGLEHLHQGCNARILHFDIKPHNILLDESFCPKISDFGLSKLWERKESIISITGARGTVGYIAPEVFCRNFGEVSYKSDVYSYGMMVLEMVGGRKNIDPRASKTSEIYFPSWIYKNLDQATNLGLQGITAEEEEEIARKLIVVSLWCIQSDPSDRPSMTKVLEMLQGSLQSLPIPPRPFVSSPVRSPMTSTSSELM